MATTYLGCLDYKHFTGPDLIKTYKDFDFNNKNCLIDVINEILKKAYQLELPYNEENRFFIDKEISLMEWRYSIEDNAYFLQYPFPNRGYIEYIWILTTEDNYFNLNIKRDRGKTYNKMMFGVLNKDGDLNILKQYENFTFIPENRSDMSTTAADYISENIKDFWPENSSLIGLKTMLFKEFFKWNYDKENDRFYINYFIPDNSDRKVLFVLKEID